MKTRATKSPQVGLLAPASSATAPPRHDRRHSSNRLDQSFADVRPEDGRDEPRHEPRDGPRNRKTAGAPPVSAMPTMPPPTMSASAPPDSSPSDQAARALLGALAQQLGIRVDRIQVRTDDESARVLAAHRAEGLMDRGVVHLPATFDPTTKGDAGLLAHEAAHVAQRLLPAPVARVALPEASLREAAEVEASAIAESFTETGRVPRVRVPLPADARAAKAGPDVASSPARPWTLGDRINYLTQTVAATRQGEIEEIVDLLSYGLFDLMVTDRDVSRVLRILAGFPLPVARAIAANIGPSTDIASSRT